MYKHTGKGSSCLKAFFGIVFYYQNITKTNKRRAQSCFCLSRMLNRNLKNHNTSSQLSFICTIHSNSHRSEFCDFPHALRMGYTHHLWSGSHPALLHQLQYSPQGLPDSVPVTCNAAIRLNKIKGTIFHIAESGFLVFQICRF